MMINLTKSVPLKELCKVTALGYKENTAQQIMFMLSHEAMIGFATELLWMYEDINDSEKSIWETHPLKVDPAPNQTVGFYLTSDSPVFILKVNTLTEKKEERYVYGNCKEISIKRKNGNKYYNLKDPSLEDIEFITIEAYELSKKNILRIKVFDNEGNDITEVCHTVVLEINREGIKDFATMLFVWADNYREGSEYVLSQIDNPEQGYNLGILLTHDSISCKFKAHDLGVANDYDSRF